MISMKFVCLNQALRSQKSFHNYIIYECSYHIKCGGILPKQHNDIAVIILTCYSCLQDRLQPTYSRTLPHKVKRRRENSLSNQFYQLDYNNNNKDFIQRGLTLNSQRLINLWLSESKITNYE